MSEPLQNFAATTAAAATTFVVMVGVEPQVILYSSIGASGAIVLTESDSRWRAMAAFVAMTFGGALIATLLARHFADGDPVWRNLIGLAVSPVYPALRETVSKRVPSLLDALLRAFRAGGR